MTEPPVLRLMAADEVEASQKQGIGLVVCDGQGVGAVVFSAGVLKLECKQVGSALDDLGLDDAPLGVSVWEGTYHVINCGDGEFDAKADGTFRPATDEEWRTSAGFSKHPWPLFQKRGVAECHEN